MQNYTRDKKHILHRETENMIVLLVVLVWVFLFVLCFVFFFLNELTSYVSFSSSKDAQFNQLGIRVVTSAWLQSFSEVYFSIHNISGTNTHHFPECLWNLPTNLIFQSHPTYIPFVNNTVSIKSHKILLLLLHVLHYLQGNGLVFNQKLFSQALGKDILNKYSL